jgi:tRNA(Glu) U13 pseudouridine synthase TruD
MRIKSRPIEIPLISHKVEFPSEKIREIMEKVIEREGVTTKDFRLNKIEKAFFKAEFILS